MEYITVKELFKITKGKKVEEIDYKNENSIRYIQIDDLRNNNNIKHCENINKYVIAKKEDIIIAWDGANAGTIGFGIEGAIGSTLAILRKENKEMDTEFCGLFLRSKSAYLREKCTGATIPHIQRRALEDIKIPKISLNKQIEIKNIINKAQELIDKRKEQIQDLDELVKSQFIEMFGDPFKNPKGWSVQQLKEIILLANNGLARRGNDKDGNIVLRLVELQDGFIDYTSPNRIKLTEAEEKRYLLQDGDFLFARVNGNPDNVGRCSAYDDIGESVYHNDHIIRVRFDENIVNNDYVSSILNSPYGKLQMKDKLKTSAGQYTINQNGISEIKITVPPIELQNQFANFVKQTDKLKFEMEKSLKELEDNFNALMQKAFNGELFN